MSTGVANYDHTAAAAVYSTSNQFSWAEAMLLPIAKAGGTILVLKEQKKQWEEINNDAKEDIDTALNGYFQCIDSILPLYKDAYPDVPEAARYVPVNPCQEQSDTIECNIGLIARGNDWAQCINRLHEQNDLTRLVVLDPRALVSMDIQSIQINDLMRGKLPVGDLMEVMTDLGENSCFNGNIGGCSAATARDIGASTLRMQAAGRSAFREHISMLELISPISRRADIREMMQTPQQRIALALQQSQLMQNDLQNYLNMQAQKPPHRLAELQTKLERCINKLQWEGAKASVTNEHVPNYANLLKPNIDAFVSGSDGWRPTVTQSTYNSPSVGGNYQNQQGAGSAQNSELDPILPQY